MRKKYKALICDVDGTLILNKKDALPTRVVANAIRRAQAVLHVGVATSRIYDDVHHILEDLHLSGPSIIHSGGQIRDLTTGEIFVNHTFTEKESQEIFNATKAFHDRILLDDEDSAFPISPDYRLQGVITGAVVRGISATEADQLINHLQLIKTLVINKIVSWDKGKVDVSVNPKTATKQHGIVELAKILKISPSEIIGVGDGYNDFPLLMACGLKVAMGNAVDELKAIADYIAPSVDEDGVLDVIEKFVL